MLHVCSEINYLSKLGLVISELKSVSRMKIFPESGLKSLYKDSALVITLQLVIITSI